MQHPEYVEEYHSIADLTTFEIGGPARYFAEPKSLEQTKELIAWAKSSKLELYPIGGGSNILAADTVFEGLLVRPANADIEILEETSSHIEVRVGAGMVWDDFVAYTVAQNWAGIECLSGIPGRVGASPVQNIGAYGQEAAQTITAVEVIDMDSGEERTIAAADCAFAYRSSQFKTSWRGKYLITAVHYQLTPNGHSQLCYKDLQKHFEGRDSEPTLAEVRQAVLEIRRSKSMLHDLSDPNHRSAGSFFLNPIVPESLAHQLQSEFPNMPTYPAPTGHLKLSAAWLIANAGLTKGFQQGNAKLSDNHVLCLVNAGGATAQELLALAHTVQDKVRQKFGIELHAEPNLLGFH